MFQSLPILQAKQIKFSFIEKSNDFLLHILTDSFAKPFLIYRYQGVVGFQEVLSESILPGDIEHFVCFNEYSSQQYFVTLISQDKVSLLEIVLKQII